MGYIRKPRIQGDNKREVILKTKGDIYPVKTKKVGANKVAIKRTYDSYLLSKGVIHYID